MDIDLLAKMVKEVMMDHDAVTLPGVGAFMADLVPATFADKGYTIYPPYRRLSFMPRQGNDTLLADFYASSNGISRDDATHILVAFLSEMKEQLMVRKTIVFPGLGRLRATRENHFFFVADEDLDIYPGGFGLEPISLKTHVETPEEVAATVSSLAAELLGPDPVAAQPAEEPQQEMAGQAGHDAVAGHDEAAGHDAEAIEAQSDHNGPKDGTFESKMAENDHNGPDNGTLQSPALAADTRQEMAGQAGHDEENVAGHDEAAGHDAEAVEAQSDHNGPKDGTFESKMAENDHNGPESGTLQSPDPAAAPSSEQAAPAPAPTHAPVAPAPAPTHAPVAPAPKAEGKKRSWKGLWITLGVMAGLVIVAAAALAILGRVAPEWLDPFLYSPEELEVLYP